MYWLVGNGPELSDRVGYNERGVVALQGVLDRFGFERRPDTFAELYGLLDYCDRLTALSGIGVVDPTTCGLGKRGLSCCCRTKVRDTAGQPSCTVEVTSTGCARGTDTLTPWVKSEELTDASLERLG